VWLSRTKAIAKYAVRAAWIVSASLMVFARQAHADRGIALWTNHFNGPANGEDQPNSLVLDTAGSVFVAGGSRGIGSGIDYAIVKYSNSGIPLWTNRYNGPGNGNDEAFVLAVGNNGDVFVTGRSEGTNNVTDFGTLAYSSLGVPLWTNRYDGPANQSDLATDLAVDKTGNVFVTGSSFGNGTYFDYATIKYSAAGAPLWTNGYNGSALLSIDFANALAVDGNGNVFVTGSTTGGGASFSDYLTLAYSNGGIPLWTNLLDGDNGLAIEVDGNNNVIVAGLSSNGGTMDPTVVKYSNAGARLWTNALGGPPAGGSVSLALDKSGNVLISGFTANGTSYDRIIAKYSADGVPLWTNRFKGPEDFFTVQGNAIAVDIAGNVFVTGSSTNDSGNYDFVTVAYSGAGAALWTNHYNGFGNGADIANAIATDAEGNVYVTGRSVGSGGNFDFATIKYSSSIPSILLNSQRLNNQLVLSWTNAGFSLQSAPAVSGTFTNIPGAASPYTNSITGFQRYFRLKGN
jgi:hypothetical protein